jgi:hypothetical protein
MSNHDINAHLHALEVGRNTDFDAYQANHAGTSAALDDQPNPLLALATGTTPTEKNDPSFGSKRKVNFQTTGHPPNEYQAHVTRIANRNQRNVNMPGSIVDRGANGGIAGQDSRKISGTERVVTVTGIDGHQMPNLEICTVGSVIDTQHGLVIGIMNQYAYCGQGNTIHSSIQMESYGVNIDEKSRRIGGTQSVNTQDDYTIHLNIIEGIPYMKMRPYTDHEWDELPHVILTSNEPWNPSVLDDVIENEEHPTPDEPWDPSILDDDVGSIENEDPTMPILDYGI